MNRYNKDGYAFRDYLLKSQRDKLNEMAQRIPNWNNLDLLVWPGRMSDDNTEDLSPLVVFAEYGLDELTSVSERYGLVLALLEVAGQKQSDFIFKELCDGVIQVSPKPAPQNGLYDFDDFLRVHQDMSHEELRGIIRNMVHEEWERERQSEYKYTIGVENAEDELDRNIKLALLRKLAYMKYFEQIVVCPDCGRWCRIEELRCKRCGRIMNKGQ